jgi:hypothetical protein
VIYLKLWGMQVKVKYHRTKVCKVSYALERILNLLMKHFLIKVGQAKIIFIMSHIFWVFEFLGAGVVQLI